MDHLGWQTALWVDAGTYLALGDLDRADPLPRRRVHDVAPFTTLGGYLREIGEGLTVVRRSAPVGLALTALAAVWVGGGFLHVAGNQHIQRAASVPGMERLGILMAALGIGSGLGTWWVNATGRRIPRPLLLGVGLLLAGCWIIAFAVSTRFAVFAIAAFLVGVLHCADLHPDRDAAAGRAPTCARAAACSRCATSPCAWRSSLPSGSRR